MRRAAMDDIARLAARDFVRHEAGFAQVVSLDHAGGPVGRSVTAFLEDDWSVSLIQRRGHARLRQMRACPRVLVIWLGTPAEGATNEHPHVFDLGLPPPRGVFVRGAVRFMDGEWTETCYRRQINAQRAAGHLKAPLRSPEQVARDLVGVRVDPVRVRLEGFGVGAESIDWAEPRGEQQ